MGTKIIVNEMPKQASDCPFSITCNSPIHYPCVCDLKRDKQSAIRFGSITFSGSQLSNCTLTENGCDMLYALNKTDF